jgi:hypothetical protein
MTAASKDLPDAYDLRQTEADMIGGVGRQALDLDLDRQKIGIGVGIDARRHQAALGKKLARAAGRPAQRRLRNSIGRWKSCA